MCVHVDEQALPWSATLKLHEADVVGSYMKYWFDADTFANCVWSVRLSTREWDSDAADMKIIIWWWTL